MDKNYTLTPSKYLLPEEIQALEELCQRLRKSDLRNSTMFLMMLQTGCRPSELLNVQWSDVFFESGEVLIRTLKGGRDRVVPLSDDLVSRLREIGRGIGPVFRIGYRRFVAIWDEYRPVKKKLHALRHTFAVRLYRDSGSDMKLVQRALGHKNIATTWIYLDMEMDKTKLREALTGRKFYVPRE